GDDRALHSFPTRRSSDLYRMEEAACQPANAGRQLAADEVKRLDTVGALVDHGDAGVAHELLHAPLGDVAVAAIDLLRHGGALVAEIGHVGLHHQIGKAHV